MTVTPVVGVRTGLNRSFSHFSVDLPFSVSGLEVYACGLVIAACGGVAAAVAAGWDLGPLFVVLPLALVAAVSERANVTLSDSLQESISLVPTVLVAVLFGPVAAALVAAVSMLPDLWAPVERRYLRWGIYTSSRAMTAVATALGAHLAAGLSENRMHSLQSRPPWALS